MACEKTFQEAATKPLGDMTLALDKGIAVLKQLVEGSSIRSTERITGVHRDTILSLLELVSTKCTRLMEEKITGVRVSNVQCDEIWGFVEQKEKSKKATGKESDEAVGDAWCFMAIEQATKLILTYHLGRRIAVDTAIFTERLNLATSGNFQINTDGFPAYKEAISYSLGNRVDFAQIIKVYGKPEGEERHYSPTQVSDIKKVASLGSPDLDIATTSHVERQNLTIRTSMRRMTRLTNAFSKKWDNLNHSYAIHFFYYNFMRVHSTLGVTPAMESKLTDHVWTWEELIRAE